VLIIFFINKMNPIPKTRQAMLKTVDKIGVINIAGTEEQTSRKRHIIRNMKIFKVVVINIAIDDHSNM